MWKKRPRLLEYWPENTDYILGLDESGTSDINSIKRKLTNGKESEIDFAQKDFTLAGIVMDQKKYDILKKEINRVKFIYWDNGEYTHKDSPRRVCFHSRDIRKSLPPFNNIKKHDFMKSLTEMMSNIEGTIIACHVDKLAHVKKYKTPIHPYHIALSFILERYCWGLNVTNKKGVVLLESRGKKEDAFLLNHIVNILEKGTNKNPASHFRNISGVYFNPKWSEKDDNRTSYVILECADLIAYPIHKEHREGKDDSLNPAYEIVKSKFLKFPEFNGWGLKIWKPFTH